MKAIPEEFRNQIRPGLTVVWWGRRSSFEIVEEVSEAAFYIYLIWSIYVLVHQLFGIETIYPAIGFLIITIYFSAHAINEMFYWFEEVYIVAADEANGGGRVYKFYGWLYKAYIDEAITSNSPTKICERPFWFRVWKYFTGQGMERVKLHSQNHTFLEGRKMPYAFSRAIDQVSGYKASQIEDAPPDLRVLPFLQQMVASGLIDRQLAETAAKETIRKHVFGTE
jgi:hypothetical protein